MEMTRMQKESKKAYENEWKASITKGDIVIKKYSLIQISNSNFIDNLL